MRQELLAPIRRRRPSQSHGFARGVGIWRHMEARRHALRRRPRRRLHHAVFVVFLFTVHHLVAEENVTRNIMLLCYNIFTLLILKFWFWQQLHNSPTDRDPPVLCCCKDSMCIDEAKFDWKMRYGNLEIMEKENVENVTNHHISRLPKKINWVPWLSPSKSLA